MSGAGKLGGFELRLWRVGLGWTQERAAEELGVSRRTYLAWERKAQCPRLVELATRALSMREAWPDAAEHLHVISRIARH